MKKLRKKLKYSLMGRLIAFGIILQLPLATSGCYGTFPVTNALYKANGELTNSTIINSIFMVIFSIFQVYSICILVDAIVLNSINFWSGDEIRIAKSYDQPDGSVATIAPGQAPNEAVITVTKDGELLAQRKMVRDEEGITTIYDRQDQVISTVTPVANGGFQLTDAEGNSRVLSGSALQRYQKSVASASSAL